MNPTASPSASILPIGQYWPVSPEGWIINPCQTDRIQHPWRSAVAMLVDLCKASFGGSLHSFYLRGSVARGTAVEHRSDIDAVCVLADRPEPRPPSWHAAIAARIRQDHPFCTGVDLRVVARDRLMDASRSRTLQFYLKTQGLCIEGEDLTSGWAPFRLSDAQLTLIGLPTALAATRNALRREPGISAAERLQLCRWVAKKVVRAGFESVAQQEGAYTRDLYPCWEAFARHHPAKAQAMADVLLLAIAPSADPRCIDEVSRLGDSVCDIAAPPASATPVDTGAAHSRAAVSRAQPAED